MKSQFPAGLPRPHNRAHCGDGMSDYTNKDFQKVAKEVADHISKKGGLVIENGWDFSQDCAWKVKCAYVGQVLNRFIRVVCIADDESIRWKKKSELIANMEHPRVLKIRNGERPFLIPVQGHPLNDPENLKSYFDSFISDYKPPKNADDLRDHLQVLQNYYSEIGRHLNNISPSIPQRIDYAMIVATGLALEEIGFRTRAAKKSIARTNKSSQAGQEKWAPMDQKIKKVINAEKPQHPCSRNDRIKIYQKAWSKHFPGVKIPGRTKFHNYHKKHNID